MGNIQNVEEINAAKNKVEPELPEYVMIDTKGESVSINGLTFCGKKMVKREYKATIMRMVEKRKQQYQREKEYVDHADKSVGIVSGKVYR